MILELSRHALLFLSMTLTSVRRANYDLLLKFSLKLRFGTIILGYFREWCVNFNDLLKTMCNCFQHDQLSQKDSLMIRWGSNISSNVGDSASSMLVKFFDKITSLFQLPVSSLSFPPCYYPQTKYSAYSAHPTYRSIPTTRSIHTSHLIPPHISLNPPEPPNWSIRSTHSIQPHQIPDLHPSRIGTKKGHDDD